MGKSRNLRILMCSVLTIVIVPTISARATDSRATSWVHRESIDSLHIRDRRDVEGKSVKAPSKSYQSCLAPGSKPGHCKHLSSCGFDIYRSNYPRMIDYMCVIEKEFIGVCCPDDASSSSQNEVLPVRGLAGSLPAIATEGDDGVIMPDEKDAAAESARRMRAARGCGLSTRDQSRITGGRPTSSREWPWVAALLRGGIQFCGGVLITDRHVLTAAHCVFRLKPREIMIRLGEYDLRFPNETRALDFKVIEMRIHKYYVESSYTNDVAIVKIHRPTIFNTYIWPICLPPIGAVFENKQATVIGWGTTSYGGAGSYTLKEVNVPIWPQDKCAARFVQNITSNHICAGVYAGNGDACQGDSGGPLMYQLGNGRWVSIGIVSWGIGCGDPNRPGIYTRVNAYLDWIFANTIF